MNHQDNNGIKKDLVAAKLTKSFTSEPLTQETNL